MSRLDVPVFKIRAFDMGSRLSYTYTIEEFVSLGNKIKTAKKQ
jgi:hypothetical protein